MKKALFLIVSILSCCNINAQTISTYAGRGDYLSNGIHADSADLVDPASGEFDKLGNYYFVEAVGGHRVRKITTDTLIYTVAGTGDAGYAGDGGLADTALLNIPTDITFDTIGNLYIADAGNNVIRKVDAFSHIITTVAGNGVFGFGGDGGPATSAMLKDPNGVCIDKKGNLYISDLDNFRIRKVTPSGVITTFAGTGLASGVYQGDGGYADTTNLGLVTDICADGNDNIYVLDFSGAKVYKIDTMGIITTYTGTSAGYTYNGDGIPANTAQINPVNIYYKDSNLYIAEHLGYRVRMVDRNGIIHTVAGSGGDGYSGDGGPADSATLSYPSGCAVDSCGNIYIPEANNADIRKVTLPYCGYQFPTEGVKNVTAQNGISVYPNPAYSTLTIRSTQDIRTITITNMVGQVVYTQNSNTNKVELNVSILSPGVYFVRVNDNYVQKFIKE